MRTILNSQERGKKIPKGTSKFLSCCLFDTVKGDEGKTFGAMKSCGHEASLLDNSLPKLCWVLSCL